MPAPSPLAPDTSRRDWTVARLASLPEDGHRYEVVDGELLVTPSPSLTHQDAVGELFVLLRAHAQQHALHCVVAPAEVVFSATRAVQPDILVFPLVNGRRPERLEEVRHLVLAVEVVSPTSIRADRHIKRRLYQSEGVEEYWIVEPASRVVERWRPSDEAPEVLAETLTWTPRAGGEPLAIDLPAYFRRVHDEMTR